MTKHCYIDCETTGLDAEKNGVIQIAGMIIIGKEVKDTFDFKVQPFESDVVEDSALSVNGISREDLESYEQPQVVYKKLTHLLDRHVDKYTRTDKMFLHAYRAVFDDDFMRSWFAKNGDNYWNAYFFYPAYSIEEIAQRALHLERAGMPNFKLETVAQYFNVKPSGDLHDAAVDVNLAFQVEKAAAKKYYEVLHQRFKVEMAGIDL